MRVPVCYVKDIVTQSVFEWVVDTKCRHRDHCEVVLAKHSLHRRSRLRS